MVIAANSLIDNNGHSLSGGNIIDLKGVVVKKNNVEFGNKENLLINKKFVHKQKKENVLLYNLRRSLPRKINADTMENIILPKLSEEERLFVTKYYSKDIFPFIKSDKPVLKPDYVLKSLPYKVRFDSLENFININQLRYKDKKFLLTYYYRDKRSKKFFMKNNVNEEIELQILKMFDLKKWYITSVEKAKLSDILEQVNVKEIRDNSVFFSNMYVKINHDFFFEHPNEHVPAMMTVEASRQFVIALCHKYFNVPFKNVNFILNGMEVNFYSYLELNYPIKIVGSINNFKLRKGVIVFIDIEVSIWQKCRKAVKINFIGKLITKDVFKILRNDKDQFKVISRYHPRPVFYHNISLRCTQNKKYLCDLIDLSGRGFQVKIYKNLDEFQKNDFFEFFMHFQEIGFIHGNCEIKWFKKEEDFIIAGFQIVDISDEDQENLKESIKRFCYVNEEREIL